MSFNSFSRGRTGHWDRYIGSLFRVDEPVPDDSVPDDSDDSLDLQLVGKFGDDVIYQRRFIRPSSQFSNVTLNKS